MPRYDSQISQRASKVALAGSLFVFLAGTIPLSDPEASRLAPAIRGFSTVAGLAILMQAASRRFPLLPWLNILTPIIPLLIYCFASTAWSLDPTATLTRSIETAAVLIFTVYWSRIAIDYSSDSREIANVIAFVIIGVTAYGLLINLAVAGTPLRFVLTWEGSDRLRLVFGFLHPLAVGDLLAIGLIALCIGKAARVSTFVLGGVLFWLLVLTDATGARMLVMVICPVLLLLTTTQPAQRVPRVILTSLALLTVGAGATLMEVDFIERLWNDQRLWTMTGRVSLWRHIADAGLLETWFGTGYDGARPAIRAVFGIPYQVHNFYLSVLVELGLVSIPLFLFFFVTWLRCVFLFRDALTWSFGAYIVVMNMNNAGTLGKGHLAFAMMLPYCWSVMSQSRSLRKPVSHTGLGLGQGKRLLVSSAHSTG